MKKHWKYGVLGLAVAGLVVAYMVLQNRPLNPKLPVPNGYDDLLKAAQQAVSHTHLTYGEASDAELRELVNENRPALTLARLGCTRQCAVATDHKLSLTAYSAQHMPVLAQVKKLALAFRAEGELAEREGKTNDAARVYVDGIRFGQEVCRGGLLIDRLVGIACEGINLSPLNTLVPDLDAQTCKELARLLEKMDTTREPTQVTWDQERNWALSSGGILERIKNRMILLVAYRNLQTIRQNAESRFAQIQFQERDLMLRLAARAYQWEHGKAPDRPGDLVPEYLAAIPKHPGTGQELALP